MLTLQQYAREKRSEVLLMLGIPSSSAIVPQHQLASVCRDPTTERGLPWEPGHCSWPLLVFHCCFPHK